MEAKNNIYDSPEMKLALESRAKPNIEVSIPEIVEKILSMSSEDLLMVLIAGMKLAIFDELNRKANLFAIDLQTDLVSPLAATYSIANNSTVLTLVDGDNRSVSYDAPVHYYYHALINEFGNENINAEKLIFDEPIYFCITAALGLLRKDVTITVGTREIKLPKVTYKVTFFSQPCRISIYKDGRKLEDLEHYRALDEISSAVYTAFKIQ